MPEPIRVTLLHTNDMHGSLEAMSRLSTFAKALRQELEGAGRRVFFFDAGDAADRRVRFVGVSKGAAFPRILEAMGYDLQTLGNAVSVTYGPEAAGEMARRASFPILAANFFGDEGPLVAGFQPRIEFSLGEGLRLGVIGLTAHTPDIYALFSLKTPDYREAARRWLAELEQTGRGPVIAVTHLGMREDRALAEALPGIEVIIGGHSHTLLPEGEWAGRVLIAQTGDYAQHLGRVDLEIDPASGAVLSKRAVVLPVPPETPPDPAVEGAIAEAEAEASVLLAQPIVDLAEALDLDHFAECAVADLGADALRERLEADIALLSSGLFHTGLEAGLLTLGKLDACCFTTANPQLSELRGEQILAALELGIQPEFMHTMSKSFRGSPFGMLAVSGLQIYYSPDAPDGKRVREVRVNGQPLEPRRTYRVAHTDAEVHGPNQNYGVLDLEPGQLLHTEVPTILREAIAGYMLDHQPVRRPMGGRWLRER